MSRLKGDFIGFTFNNIHSSSLGIHRVSKGDRAEEALLPTIKDSTVERIGADGTFFFGSKYTQRKFSLNLAYDDMTEVEKQQLVNNWYDGEIHDLIFDETPYKVYKAKIDGEPKLEFICFEKEVLEENNIIINRIYKGEGTVDFICYNPYAYNRYKFLEDYTINNIPEWKRNNSDNVGFYKNIDEWKTSSGLLTARISQDHTYDLINVSGEVFVYNPSPIKAEPIFYLEGETIDISGVTYYDYDLRLYNNVSLESIAIKGRILNRFIRVNSKNCIVEAIANDYEFIESPIPSTGLYVIRDGEYIFKGDIQEVAGEATYDLDLNNINLSYCPGLFYNGNYFYINKSYTQNDKIILTNRAEGVTIKGNFIGIEYDYKFI